MSGIDLSNYVEVSERIEAFRTKHPEGSYRTELVELPAAFADKFVAVKAYVYRSPSDQAPGVDMAWEPVPGKTPYTKDSELQNACTSAIGRAIIAALAADARRGIASREEVQGRQPAPRKPKEKPVEAPETPADGSVEAEVKRLKNWVLKETGDVDKAKVAWRETLASYGLAPLDLPTAEMLSDLENDLQIAVKEMTELEVAKP